MKKIILITAGRGPVECSRVVAKVQELIMKHARRIGVAISVLDSVKGELPKTLLSTTLMAEGADLTDLINQWQGSVQWISKSPYRPMHKRKNWFVGVSFFDIKDDLVFNIRDVEITTCRSSGNGGQSVNTTNSAVRAKHIPTGIQVQAMDTRTMLQNKAFALERLEAKVLAVKTAKLVERQQDKWQEHNELERGNPVKTIEERLK